MNNQKTIFFTFFLLINVIHLFGQYAQENIPGKIKDSIHTSPNYPPKLIDGEKESQLIATRLKHPLYAIQNGIYGIVEVFLTVDTSGNIINSEIKKGLGFGCDKEAQRVLQFTSGKWTSAKHWGKKVYAKFSVPVKFTAKNDQLTDRSKGKFKTAVKEFDRKHYEGALSFFNSALRESPNYIDAIYYQGECYFKLNRPQDACNSWKKSYELGKTGSLENSKAQFCNNNFDSSYVTTADTGTRVLVAIDSVLYTKDFVFKDGIYTSFKEFQFNSPSVVFNKNKNKYNHDAYSDFDIWYFETIKSKIFNKTRAERSFIKKTEQKDFQKTKLFGGFVEMALCI